VVVPKAKFQYVQIITLLRDAKRVVAAPAWPRLSQRERDAPTIFFPLLHQIRCDLQVETTHHFVSAHEATVYETTRMISFRHIKCQAFSCSDSE